MMGKRFRKFRYYAYIVLTIVGVLVMGGLVFRSACMKLPEARATFGVASDGDYSEPTRAAMDLINGFVGCEFLIQGESAMVMSTDGEPCGLAFHENIESGHSAMAYACSPDAPNFRGYRWELHVEQPGNIHTQVCIVAHELGHALGLEDASSKRSIGIMNQHRCPENRIVLSDAESKFLRDKFCYEW